MPAERIAMRRIREVLRLKHECDLSYAQIAQALRLSKGTVSNYLIRAAAAGITHGVAVGLDDATLLSRLHPQRYVYREFATPDLACVHRELKKKGVTLQLLWEEYRESVPGIAYSRSRFCELYVAAWGASNYTYAEARGSETKPDRPVPHALVGQEVELRVTQSALEVLWHNRRIASHARSNRRGGYTTVSEHMPASHRAHREWTPKRLMAAQVQPGQQSAFPPNQRRALTHQPALSGWCLLALCRDNLLPQALDFQR